jgi:hypothetical protein
MKQLLNRRVTKRVAHSKQFLGGIKPGSSNDSLRKKEERGPVTSSCQLRGFLQALTVGAR